MHIKNHATFLKHTMSIWKVKLHTFPYLVILDNYFGINFEFRLN